jgi:hypothetical protein
MGEISALLNAKLWGVNLHKRGYSISRQFATILLIGYVLNGSCLSVVYQRYALPAKFLWAHCHEQGLVGWLSGMVSQEKITMQKGKKAMFFVPAMIAIIGAVGYQYFVKQIPAGINPVVSVIGTYIAVLILSFILLPFFPADGGLLKHFRQLTWVQLAVAICVLVLELGFLLMYRYGWNLSTGNLVTGVFINIILVTLGVALLGEKISSINAIGIAISILGVALIGYRP